jgi:hypothetical protein
MNNNNKTFNNKDEEVVVVPVALKTPPHTSPPASVNNSGSTSPIRPDPVSVSDTVNSDFQIFDKNRETKDFITHPRLSAFMNWIPVDRTSEYLCNVFKVLNITEEASVVMKAAFSDKRSLARPHNIAYITIAANSIIDSKQGNLFLQGIQSEKYQIILDCGHEPQLSKWQYRVYPTKKKLLPNEVPASELPQLGVMNITMDDASITSDVPMQKQSDRKSLADNLSDVSSIGPSDNTFSLPVSHSKITYSNVTKKNILTDKTGNPKKLWSDYSDDDTRSSLEKTVIEAEPESELDTSLCDDNKKLTDNIKELYEKSVANVAQKQAKCDEAKKRWEESTSALQFAKSEQVRYQQLLNLTIGFKSLESNINNNSPPAKESKLEEAEDNELFVNTDTNNAKNFGGNNNNMGNNYMIDPHSGQVTPVTPVPVLYLNMDGSLSPSPVVPTHTQNWLPQYPHYGPPPAQYNAENDTAYYHNNGVCSPVDTPTNTTHYHAPTNYDPNIVEEKKKTVTSAGAAPFTPRNNSTTAAATSDVKTAPGEKEDNKKEKATDNNIIQDLMKYIDSNNISSDQLKTILDKNLESSMPK